MQARNEQQTQKIVITSHLNTIKSEINEEEDESNIIAKSGKFSANRGS